MLDILRYLFGLHVHSFTKWEVTNTYTRYRSGTEFVLGERKVQERTCCECGKLEMRTVYIDLSGT